MESESLYVENCNTIQKLTHYLQTLVGQMSRRFRTLKSRNDLDNCCQLAENVVSRVSGVKALLEELLPCLPKSQQDVEKRNRQLMHMKLSISLCTTSCVIKHLLCGLLLEAASVGSTCDSVTVCGRDVIGKLLLRIEPFIADFARLTSEEVDVPGSTLVPGVFSDANTSWGQFCDKQMLRECILMADSVVTEEPSLSSCVVGMLPAGTQVTVQKVLREEQGRYLRGHIKEAAGYGGFITLCDAKYDIGSVYSIPRGDAGIALDFDIFETTQQLTSTTQQFASNAFSLMAKTIPELGQRQELSKLPDLHTDEYTCGEYTLTRDTAVNEEEPFGSRVIIVLSAGTHISVLEVYRQLDESRIRGRIAMPDGNPGFITLRFSDYIFVHKVTSRMSSGGGGIHLGPRVEPAALVGKLSGSFGIVLGTTQKLASNAVSSMTGGMLDLHGLREPEASPDPNEYVVGDYILSRDAALTEQSPVKSRRLGILSAGTRITVLKVVDIPQEHRVRGRMLGPGGYIGFITLCAYDQVFVCHVDDHNNTESVAAVAPIEVEV